MKTKINILILLFISFFTTTVYATNSIDYTLNITDNFEFKETINYRIENYKSPKNGYNYMSDIINKKIPADILGKTHYDKKKRLSNDVYYVTLTKTFNEYTMSNSAFLNNCFQNPKYEYDMKKYSFSGKGGFNCYDADNMKLTIITNFPLINTDATQEGNKYIWTPTNEKFTMNISLEKKYKEADTSTSHMDEDNDEEAEEKIDPTIIGEETKNQKKNKEKSKAPTYIFISIIIIITGAVIFVVPILKQKSSDLDKI